MHYRALLVVVTVVSCSGNVSGEEAPTKVGPRDWPRNASPKEVGGKAAEFVLAEPMKHEYQHACGYHGILMFSEATGNTSLRDRVVDAYGPYRSGKSKPTSGHVDNNVFGIVPLDLFLLTREPAYLAQGKALADEEWEKPRPDGLTRYTRWWLDDMYMVGCLQARAYKATGDLKYADRGAEFLLAYTAKLQQANGLLHHSPRWPYYWVRGNGWAASSMTEMLLVLPADHKSRPRLLAAYQALMKGLVACQEPTGMWPQLLDYPHVRPESSGTGMYVFSLATGVREGWLPDEPYRKAAEQGWIALTEYVDSRGRVREVSHGTTSKDVKRYLCNDRYPVGDYHGQAAVLWAASALIQKK
jgi:unsaturated rhamnogalacturonyl hydrolase